MVSEQGFVRGFFEVFFIDLAQEMTSMKLDIEKFNRNQNFGLRQVKMKAILVQNGVQTTFDGVDKMTQGMTMTKWEEIDLKVLSAVQLYLSNEVLREVVKESTTKGIWDKLELLYMPRVSQIDCCLRVDYMILGLKKVALSRHIWMSLVP